MNVNNNYPHPVLGNSNDFISNDFKLSIRTAEQDFKFRYICFFDLGVFHDDIKKMIDDGLIEYVVQVYSPRTSYREIFSGNESSFKFEIPVDKISGRIQFFGYLIAKNHIENYQPEGLNKEFFTDMFFKIFTGDILGVSNRTDTFIDPKFKKPLKSSTKSIIRFIPDNDLKSHFEVKNWNEDQINVLIPKKIIDLKERFKDLHIQAIFLPIIAEALSIIHSENNEFEDLKWYYVLNKEFNKLDIDVDCDNFYKAQILLQKPFKNYLNKINSIDELIANEQ